MGDSKDTAAPETAEEKKEETVKPKPKPKSKKSTAKKKKPPTKKESKVPVTKNFEISLTDLILPKKWNRDTAVNIDKLATSIKLLGQIVALTVEVHPNKKDKYILRDGRRRYLALKAAKIPTAIVSFPTGNYEEVDEDARASAANLCREGHSPIETAHIFAIEAETKSNRTIAQEHGKSEGYVSQHIGLLRLPPKMQTAVKNGKVSFAQVRALQRVNKEEHQTKFDTLAQKVLEGMTTHDVEANVVAYLDREKVKGASKKKGGKKADKGKNQGRPPKIKDYDEVKKDIAPIGKTKLYEYLVATEERRARTKSPTNSAYLRGKRDGLELAGGLQED